jgi:hypothetical protein
MSNLSTLPKGDSAWLLRKAIQRVMQQVSVLETNIGASTTGNSANSQVIFNDDGTLRGDPDLIFNTALNKLVATNLEATAALTVGTSATITGNLTVDTNVLFVDAANNRVGIGTATPNTALEVFTASTNTRIRINSTEVVATEYFRSGVGLWLVGSDSTNAFKIARGSNFGGSADYFAIASADAAATWYDAAGGTRMTLNSTGLGLGVTPSAWNSAAKAIQSSAGAVASNGITTWFGSNVFYDSTYTPKYIGTSFAGSIVYNPAGFGGWDFNIAASGTAGNTVTFSTPMKLDANGNLILLSSATPATLTVNGQLTVNATSNTNLRFSYRGSDGTTRVANITLA